MNLNEVLTKDLLDELVGRLNTCLVLGITVDSDNSLTFHRRCHGPNTWALYAPLLSEVRWLDKDFDDTIDGTSPDDMVEF